MRISGRNNPGRNWHQDRASMIRNHAKEFGKQGLIRTADNYRILAAENEFAAQQSRNPKSKRRKSIAFNIIPWIIIGAIGYWLWKRRSI